MLKEEMSAPQAEENEEAIRLREENARLSDELARLAASHEQQLLRLSTESAIREGLLRRGARDPRTVLPLLRLQDIRLEEGRLSGLDEQLAAIRSENSYLFSDAQLPRLDSGFAHGSAPGTGAPATLAGALSEHYR